MNDLELYTPAKIAAIQDPSEAVNVNRWASAAAKIYAAQDNHETAQWMRRIYLESARRAGELFLEAPRQPGVKSNEVTPYQALVDGSGASRYQAQTWQDLAKIDQDTFKKYLNDAKYQGTEYTVNGLKSYASGKREIVVTQEGMLKIINHWITRYRNEYPDGDRELWRVVSGEWKAAG